MADYTVYQPPSTDNLDVATPANSEDASKLSAAVRQLKNVVKNVLLKEHNADGSHKSVDQYLAAGSVTGDKISSSSTDNNKRAIGADHIRNGSVTKEKMATQSISGDMLEDESVGTGKIASQAVGAGNIAPGAVNSSHILANSIGGANIAPGGVTNGHLAADAVTADKVKDGELGPEKLALALSLLIAGGATEAKACQVGGNMTMEVDETTDPPTARFNIRPGSGTLLPVCVMREVAENGGSAAANTWNNRPANGALTVDFDGGFILASPPLGTIIFRKTGIYLAFLQASAYKTQLHQLRLRDITNSRTLLLGSLVDAEPSVSSQTTSLAMGIVNIPADNTEVRIQHFTQTAKATDGLGRSLGAATGEQQVLGHYIFIQLN